MIEASAPGKVVLWGEYAVLTGAPALVMAVDRYARCQLQATADVWEFAALGFAAPAARIARQRLLAADPPPADAVWRTVWQALRAVDGAHLPQGGQVCLDTRSFHHHGSKLGLGSSAAICVAAYGALCRLLGQQPSYTGALAVHRQLQGGAGSGIDVAASWHGGTVKFLRGDATEPGPVSAWSLPAELHVTFIWTGRPASTVDHLARFRAWLERGQHAPLDALSLASQRLFETERLEAALKDYVAALQALDAAASLGIFSDAHVRLGRLAIEAGVVYKPCGAGGGDLGAAFTDDAAAAARFARMASAQQFLPIPLEIASHGFQVTG
ncbi:MAG: mevalonate kinase [Pseudomonadales bacterium]